MNNKVINLQNIIKKEGEEEELLIYSEQYGIIYIDDKNDDNIINEYISKYQANFITSIKKLYLGDKALFIFSSRMIDILNNPPNIFGEVIFTVVEFSNYSINTHSHYINSLYKFTIPLDIQILIKDNYKSYKYISASSINNTIYNNEYDFTINTRFGEVKFIKAEKDNFVININNTYVNVDNNRLELFENVLESNGPVSYNVDYKNAKYYSDPQNITISGYYYDIDPKNTLEKDEKLIYVFLGKFNNNVDITIITRGNSYKFTTNLNDEYDLVVTKLIGSEEETTESKTSLVDKIDNNKFIIKSIPEIEINHKIEIMFCGINLIMECNK